MRRILIYGVSGSGKSTLARRTAERLGLPYVAVDDLTWRPGWVPVPTDEQRAIFTDVCAGDDWVLDSAYAQWMDLVLARADLIVGLDLPRWRSLSRLLRRTITEIVRRTETCNGNVTTWRGSFLARDSIVRFHFGSFGRKRRRMRAWQHEPGMPPVVLLRTPADVERWLAAL